MKALFTVLIILAIVCLAQATADQQSTSKGVYMEQCKLRPATIMQISKLREGSQKLAASVKQEAAQAQKRKEFIEKMTNYINERIRELNRVKQELQEEIKFIEVGNRRIAAIEEQERLLRAQDVFQCLSTLREKPHFRADAGFEKEFQEASRALQEAEKTVNDLKSSLQNPQ